MHRNFVCLQYFSILHRKIVHLILITKIKIAFWELNSTNKFITRGTCTYNTNTREIYLIYLNFIIYIMRSITWEKQEWYENRMITYLFKWGSIWRTTVFMLFKKIDNVVKHLNRPCKNTQTDHGIICFNINTIHHWWGGEGIDFSCINIFLETTRHQIDVGDSSTISVQRAISKISNSRLTHLRFNVC